MLNQILSNLADFRETVEVHSQFLMQPTFIHWQELSVGVMVVLRYIFFAQAIIFLI